MLYISYKYWVMEWYFLIQLHSSLRKYDLCIYIRTHIYISIWYCVNVIPKLNYFIWTEVCWVYPLFTNFSFFWMVCLSLNTQNGSFFVFFLLYHFTLFLYRVFFLQSSMSLKLSKRFRALNENDSHVLECLIDGLFIWEIVYRMIKLQHPIYT